MSADVIDFASRERKDAESVPAGTDRNSERVKELMDGLAAGEKRARAERAEMAARQYCLSKLALRQALAEGLASQCRAMIAEDPAWAAKLIRAELIEANDAMKRGAS